MENEDIDRGDDFESEEEIEEIEEVEEKESEEETEEEESEEEIEEEEEPPKKEPRIPKSRFDEVIQQREDAKERNLWLEAQLEKLINKSQEREIEKPKVKDAYDFSKSEEEYISLVIDGEIAKATKLRSQIDAARREEMLEMLENVKTTTSNKAKEESSIAIENDRFSALIENMESKYKFLDANSKDYNEEAVDTINTLLKGYVASGKSKSEGLRLAVNKVVPMYSKEQVQQKQTLGEQRKVAAGKRAAEASKSQPVKTKSTGTKTGSDTVNISKLSDKDFRSLSDKEKRILRGD
ncbi:ribosomal protein [Caudoviricetes sp.]|nr:ribosomal protein [Caudoviricetes sp.]